MLNRDAIDQFSKVLREYSTRKDYIACSEELEKIVRQFAASYRIVSTNPKGDTWIEILDADGLIVIEGYFVHTDIEVDYNIKAVK